MNLKRLKIYCVCAALLSGSIHICFAQENEYWHNKPRSLRYQPEGEDLVIINGDRKFNRALYGTHTAFRIETSDVPELGFFMPHNGGNLRMGLIKGNESIWMNDARQIKSIYRAGARIYEITDPMLGNGRLSIYVLAMSDAEGAIIKIESENIPKGLALFTTYGGANNKRFSRNADLGVDASDAFELHPEACEGNEYALDEHTFSLVYGQGTKGGKQYVEGWFPTQSHLKLAMAEIIASPLNAYQSTAGSRPVLVAVSPLSNTEPCYINIWKKDGIDRTEVNRAQIYEQAEIRRREIAETVKINTPDPYFNPLGGIISIAADGIWEPDCWLHGAIGWRMPLNGWRAAYTGDAIGWHDRSRRHFTGYAASQVTGIPAAIPHPTQDSVLNLARAEKRWGTQMYSNGYICRNPHEAGKMHHYDMNLVYMDELLWHLNWTGDVAFAKEIWPVIERHLAWEKRNFDPDGDGLYDAYACIWASDALQYNSGGVTHSSAYNYRANKMAAMIAEKIGKEPAPYRDEAEKILKAINARLWIAEKGWWAEFQDFMGHRLLHPNAALWTVYHAIDSDIHTPFQSYQATRYVDHEIPHIPVRAEGLPDEGCYTLSTTNWLPYSWSINNVAFAEVAHTALAYWQSGRADEAYKLFKSSILDGMYLGSSPGNIGQVSFYDAARGECYRDFGDPVGVYSRVLVQGLFGILPDLMNDCVQIRPGFPADWEHASIATPDIAINYMRKGKTDCYTLENRFGKPLTLTLSARSRYDDLSGITVNGKPCRWRVEDESMETPMLHIDCDFTDRCVVEIEWGGNLIASSIYKEEGIKGETWTLTSPYTIAEVYDPQSVLNKTAQQKHTVTATLNGEIGHRTLFVKLTHGKLSWWEPINIELKEPFTVNYKPEAEELNFTLTNNAPHSVNAQLIINDFSRKIAIEKEETSEKIVVPASSAQFGTNKLSISVDDKVVYTHELINWNIPLRESELRMLNLTAHFNDAVTQVFKNEYLSPRSPYTTLQLPKQGIGEWCHPGLTAEIDDAGLRAKAASNGFNDWPVPFDIPSTGNNILFTSLWDNYPTAVELPLTGKAAHVYLLMAGTTNHMQCHIVNGVITVTYTDGSSECLNICPPRNWAPIEQDYFIDGMAFCSEAPRPYRVALKSGIMSRNLEKELNINPSEVYGRTIDGGAGILLDLPLNVKKELMNIKLETVANDVVIGLMGITLIK